MVIAVLFGLAASSALVIGAAVGVRWSPPKQVTGVLLAFASGALISALAFELFEEAFHLGGRSGPVWACSPVPPRSSRSTPPSTATSRGSPAPRSAR
jgi:zinc transporter ZupT